MTYSLTVIENPVAVIAFAHTVWAPAPVGVTILY
jgi:hypothetical protein